MYGQSKLQPEFSVIGLAQPFIALVIFALVWGFFGITSALTGMAIIFGIYGLISLTYLRRTENLWYLATFAFQTSTILLLLLNPKLGIFPIRTSSFGALIILMVVLIILMLYIIIAKKLKWRGREILELAAQKVSDTSNGFTERPKPLGKVDFTTPELTGFTLFLKSNLILWPIEEADRILFIPISVGDEYRLPLGFSSNYSENTWIAIDKAGNIAVQISKKDYIRYKETLAFDQLNESLGQLFIDFFETYKRKEEARIIYELNRVRAHPFA